MSVLAGDIGATNARLAVFEEDGPLLRIVAHKVYASSEFSSLDEIVREFLKTTDAHCDTACLGVPGPVSSDQTIVLTNVPWKVERGPLISALASDRLALINDVEASALGIPELSKNDLVCLNEGHAEPGGNRVILSIGTGLGVAGLGPNGRAFATEAGHADFSPSEDFDIEFLRSLRSAYGHVSWERVASGPALVDILKAVAHSQSVSSPSLSPSAIVEAAGIGRDQLCVTTLKIFQRYVGAVAGNITLSLGATGGVYFTGGVAPNIINVNDPSPVLDAFCDKGRMRPLLERIPVNLVLADDIALRGAARTALGLR